MTPDRAALLAQIDAFDFDGPDTPALPFAARLARENGWSRPYADRVIREYKRYVFLSVTSDGPVCPSEDVDAAWHLHLTYTRSYWERFCGGVLGRRLHHDPTKGGPAEADKHLRMYARTLDAYRAAFGEEPPAEVWPAAAVRFGHDLRHRVVNTARNWVVPKRPVGRVLQATAAFVAVAALVPGCDGGLNPFDLVGADFLGFLIPMLIAAACVGRVIRSGMRNSGPSAGEDDRELGWETAAYLAGGYPRLTTAAIARLVESGAVRVEGDRLVREQLPGVAMSRLETAVWGCVPVEKSGLGPVQRAVEAAFASRAERLEQDGYVISKARAVGSGCASLIPLVLVVACFAVPRLVMGLGNGKPVGYVVAATVIGGIIGVVVASAGSMRLTRRGEGLVSAHRAKHASLKTSASGDAAMAVALFGTAALAGSAVAHLQAWYPRQTDASTGCGSGCGTGSGCSGGGGGCGGGCGGGGCGGCGGS